MTNTYLTPYQLVALSAIPYPDWYITDESSLEGMEVLSDWSPKRDSIAGKPGYPPIQYVY